ncbi:MAG: hypothetical protein AAB425_06140, partial [Bdellovibrionota bacterium]
AGTSEMHRIESFERELGTEQMIHLKTTLFAKLLAAYPELKNLPRERLGEAIQVIIDLGSGIAAHGFSAPDNEYPSATIRMGVGKRGALSQVGGVFYTSNRVQSQVESSVPRLLPSENYSPRVLFWSQLNEPWRQLDEPNDHLSRFHALFFGNDANREFAKSIRERLNFGPLLKSVVDAANFKTALPAGELQTLLELYYPEWRTYFKLDQLLKLAVQNPESLTAYMREEIAAAERGLKEILTQQEITRAEYEARIQIVRRDLSLLEAQAKMSREEIQSLRTATAQIHAESQANLDTQQRKSQAALQEVEDQGQITRREAQTVVDRLAGEKLQLEDDILKARTLLDDVLTGTTLADFHISDTLSNLEIIEMSDGATTAHFRARASSWTNGLLTQELFRTVESQGDGWIKKGLRITITPKVVAFKPPAQGMRTWFGGFAPKADGRVEIVLEGEVSGQAVRKRVFGSMSFVMTNNSIKLDPQGGASDIGNFYFEIATAAQTVIQGDRLSDVRHKIARTVGEGGDLTTFSRAAQEGILRAELCRRLEAAKLKGQH